MWDPVARIMSLEIDILRCLESEDEPMTPLKVARWLIENDADHEDDDEDDLKDEVARELDDLEDRDLVVKDGRSYEITGEGQVCWFSGNVTGGLHG